jgi:hypothetical protein
MPLPPRTQLPYSTYGRRSGGRPVRGSGRGGRGRRLSDTKVDDCVRRSHLITHQFHRRLTSVGESVGACREGDRGKRIHQTPSPHQVHHHMISVHWWASPSGGPWARTSAPRWARPWARRSGLQWAPGHDQRKAFFIRTSHPTARGVGWDSRSSGPRWAPPSARRWAPRWARRSGPRWDTEGQDKSGMESRVTRASPCMLGPTAVGCSVGAAVGYCGSMTARAGDQGTGGKTITAAIRRHQCSDS